VIPARSAAMLIRAMRAGITPALPIIKVLPMSLDPATVRRIAKLSRLHLEEADIPRVQGELNSILGWIEQLNAVNVDGIEPLTGAAVMAMRMRDDVVTDGGMADAVLANAPDRDGPYYAVPKVVE
jgi:aspartyl-tRNA(Asn)/glutamyl-tRNA(Gln) amidotransferase subunit C